MLVFDDRRAALWGGLAIALGVAFSIGLELLEEPELPLTAIVLELIGLLPAVFLSVGVMLLFRITARQREEHLTVLRDLEVARLHGQRWRSESRALLNGLGEAIDAQFSRWSLTDAEREVALLLLKGLSLKEWRPCERPASAPSVLKPRRCTERPACQVEPRSRRSFWRTCWHRSNAGKAEFAGHPLGCLFLRAYT